MMRLKVRSMVGLVPLFAVETLEPGMLDRLKGFERRLDWLRQARPDLTAQVSRWFEPGQDGRRLLSLMRGDRMKCVLRRMLDETEFLSDYGVRALSRGHQDQPVYRDPQGRATYRELLARRVTVRAVRGQFQLARTQSGSRSTFSSLMRCRSSTSYYGDDFKVECPTGSGNYITLLEVARELTRRLGRIFLRDDQGRRAVFGDYKKLQTDPHFRDYPLFYEYFHGDTGRGVGASHQTGWTGLIATLIQHQKVNQ